MENQSVVITRPVTSEVVSRPIESINENEVLVKVHASGICGTDIHIYEGDYIGSYPIVPGHEFAGEVVTTGENVSRFFAGDRVAIEPNISCNNCWYCLNNQQNFCSNWQAIGVTIDGGMAQFVTVPESAVFSIGDMSFETGAFVEPLSCVIHGVEKLHPKSGGNALLFGGGPIGLLILQMLRGKGIAHIDLVELNKKRAAIGESLGATRLFNSTDTLRRENYDYVIDATGVIEVMEQTVAFVRKGGKILFFGVPPQSATLQIKPFTLFQNGISIVSSFTSVRNSFQAINLLKYFTIDVSALVSHRIPLQEFDKGIGYLKDKNEFSMKVQLLPHEVT